MHKLTAPQLAIVATLVCSTGGDPTTSARKHASSILAKITAKYPWFRIRNYGHDHSISLKDGTVEVPADASKLNQIEGFTIAETWLVRELMGASSGSLSYQLYKDISSGAMEPVYPFTGSGGPSWTASNERHPDFLALVAKFEDALKQETPTVTTPTALTKTVEITPEEAALLANLRATSTGRTTPAYKTLEGLVTKVGFKDYPNRTGDFLGGDIVFKDASSFTDYTDRARAYFERTARLAPALASTSPFKVGETYKLSDNTSHTIIAITADRIITSYGNNGRNIYDFQLDGSPMYSSRSVRLLPPEPPVVERIRADTSAVAELIRANARAGSVKVATVKVIRATYDVGLVEAKEAFDALAAG